MQIAEQQVRQGNLFLLEQPHSAKSWQDRHVQRVSKLHGIGSVIFDKCMFHLVHVQLESPIGREPASCATVNMYCLSLTARAARIMHRSI